MEKNRDSVGDVMLIARRGKGGKRFCLRHRSATWLIGIMVLLAGLLVQQSAFAAEFSVTPITWDVIGLDSNDPQTGPNQFPVGVRVCNNTGVDQENVTAKFVWDSGGTATDSEIYLRPGTLQTLSVASLAADACTDFYYEVQVDRDLEPYDQTRLYHVNVASDEYSGPYSSEVRELYVEHLISQNRNSTDEVWYGTEPASLTSVEPGGTLTMMVGETYYIKLVGTTATQGYEQLESFINIPNTIFQVLSVATDYTSDTSGTVSNPNDKLYGDACLWENDFESENFRSCLSTGKVGGDIEILYEVKILQMPGAPLVNPEPIQTLIYDFSGSSYHYNADWSASTRYIEIVTANITKSFSPKTILPGGASTMTFTITNPGSDPLTDVAFDDDDGVGGLPGNPSWPSGMEVFGDQSVGYSGCGESSATPPTPATVNDADVAVNFSGITVAGYGTCTITVVITADDTAPSYTNTTSNLQINGGTDTGSYGEDTLVVGARPPATCDPAAPLATWTMPNLGSGPPLYTTKAPDVLNATASYVTVSGENIISAIGNPANSWAGTAPTPSTPKDVGWSETATSSDNYFQFEIDTSNYGGVTISLDVNPYGNGDWANPNSNVFIKSSTDGINFTVYELPDGTYPQASKDDWVSLSDIPAAATGASKTWFRISIDSGSKSGSTLLIDNIIIKGCPYPEYPTLTKAFSDASICQTDGSTPTLPVSTLTFSLTNPNASDLTGVGFTDTLPTGLAIADPNGLTTPSCLSGGTLTADAGTSLIELRGATLSANADCTIAVNVVGNTAGQYKNVSGTITSDDTGPNTTPPPDPDSGYGEADLQVIALPLIGKSFGSNPIFVGDTTPTKLAFSVRNPDTATTLTGINFTDNLPGGLRVANPNGLTGACGGGTITANADSTTVSLAGASLAPGAECTFSVNVVAPTGTTAPQSLTNTATVNTTQTCSNSVSVDFLIKEKEPKINLLKQVGPTASGPWTNYLAVTPDPPGSSTYPNVYYRFVVENTGDLPLTSATLTDSDIDVSGCESVLSTGLLLYETKTCVSGAASVSEPGFINRASVSGTDENDTTVSNSCSATDGLDICEAQHETSELVLDKQVNSISTGGSTFNTAGDIITYDYVVTNNGADLIDPVVISDNKIANITCPSVTSSNPIGNYANILESGEVLTCTASYTVTADDVKNGGVLNVAFASAPLSSDPTTSVTSNTDSVEVLKTGFTYASISSFAAYVNDNNRVVLEWTTASEMGTIGFLLERLNEQTGGYEPVTKELLPSLFSSPHGGIYRYVDKKAEVGREYAYRVIEVAVNHSGTTSGPYTVRATQPLPENERMTADGPEGYTLAHEEFTKKQLKRFAAYEKAVRNAAAKKKEKTGNTLKVPVSKNGLVYLSAGELATASGLPKKKVEQYLKSGKCLVTLQGVSVPVLAANSGSGLWFYGEAPKRKDIGQNIYRFQLGQKGVKMKNAPGVPDEAASDVQSFFAQNRVEENGAPFHIYIDTPVKDLWAWARILAYGKDTTSGPYSIDAPYMTGSGTAILTVDLVGVEYENYGSADSFKVDILLNENKIGTAEWSEKGDYQFSAEVSADQLNEDDNKVTLISRLNRNVQYSVVYLESIGLDYNRAYQAVDGELFFNDGGYNQVTVEGFTRGTVLALDVTDPFTPRRLRPLIGKNQVGEYNVTILTEPGSNYYITENIDSTISGEIHVVDTISYLRNEDNQADYVIITSLGLMDSAKRLAEYRASQGMTTMLVDIEDIQDEFSYGLLAPEAVHDFLAYVSEKWSRVPRYITLIGVGSYDYQNYLDYGYPQVPSVLVQTPVGFLPSDNFFADVIGDDKIPEFALGRIPAYNSRELDSFISKLIFYEENRHNKSTELTLITDRADPSVGDFEAAADKVAALMSPYFTVNRLSAETQPLSSVRGQIVEAMQQGSGIMHYIGHSTMTAYGRHGKYLLTASEIEDMQEIGNPMLMFSASCGSASFGYPTINSIGETALLKAGGAASAFYGATGMVRNHASYTMSEGFYRSFLDPINPSLGDAIVSGKQYYADQCGDQRDDRYLLDVYNLLGDPATVIQR